MIPPELLRIQIEPTNRCNFRCGYCRRSHWNRPIGDLTFTRFTILLDKLSIVPRIHLQGVGEPLLNPDLVAMIRLARQRGIRVGTSTNGSLLTRGLAEALLDAGINRINLSLDTTDPLAFSIVRRGAPLETIVANIGSLAEARGKGCYPDTELAIAVVAQQSTIAELPNLVTLAAQLGLDEVYVQNLNNDFLPADYVSSQMCAPTRLDAYREATRSADALANRLGIGFHAPNLGELDFDWRCSWPFHGCNITWDGFVSPCCLQPDPDVLNFGNVYTTEFDEIWLSPAYDRFRKEVDTGKAAICRGCPDVHGQMWHPKAAPFASRRLAPAIPGEWVG